MVEALASIYRPRFSAVQAFIFQEKGYRLAAYLKSFWSEEHFTRSLPAGATLDIHGQCIKAGLQLFHAVLYMASLALVLDAHDHNTPGQLQFGLALAIATPLLAAHLMVVAVFTAKIISSPFRAKKIIKSCLCTLLERQVKKLRAANNFKVVAVAGSVGKTSSKMAVAEVLNHSMRVRYQVGNYNDRLTVPLVIFGHELPQLTDIAAWLRIYRSNSRQIKNVYPFDAVVLELGTDHPGEIAKFGYLQPDISVMTAITPEHMEYFGNMDAVAAEEMAVSAYSRSLLINTDDTPPEYTAGLKFRSYGRGSGTDYRLVKTKPRSLDGQTITTAFGKRQLSVKVSILGQHGAKICLAAIAVADMLGVSRSDISSALKQIRPFAGRMQVLSGIDGTTLIDDTYNSSPAAVLAALDVLYGAPAKQRIAVLGSMNELGRYSREAHKAVGEYCDPKKLDLVVTIGADANTVLAESAERRGCRVERFDSPYTAGEFIKANLVRGAVILAKGSQNRVYAEEAIKILLADEADSGKLVRQSPYWLDIKTRQFKA